MRFLSAWTDVGFPTLVIALLVPGILALATFLPGRASSRVAAVGVAITVLGLGVLGLDGGVRWSWAALWLLVAWRTGRPRPLAAVRMPRPGGIEAGSIGLLLGVAMLALFMSAVARSELESHEARCASFGLLLIALGLLQLMLRRDAARALLAFGALGLGLQVLLGAAHDELLGAAIESRWSVLLGSALALALADRVVRAREISAGTAWVGEAHDLHD